MKSLNFRIIIVLISVSVLFGACNKETQQEKKKKLDYFVEHSYSVNGKKIKFSLPKWYSDKNIKDKLELPHYLFKEFDLNEFVFFSTKHDYNYFAMGIVEDGENYKKYNNDENILLDSFASYYVENYCSRSPGTMFKEKRFQKNNKPYYLLMGSIRYPNRVFFDNSVSVIYKSDSIESEFFYVTYFGKERYILYISSIESIKDFSYEEKRQVLESISIE